MMFYKMSLKRYAFFLNTVRTAVLPALQEISQFLPNWLKNAAVPYANSAFTTLCRLRYAVP
jgi:hypothetical protein